MLAKDLFKGIDRNQSGLERLQALMVKNTYISKTSRGYAIKKILASERRDIEEQNRARKIAGLPLIAIRERKCLNCGSIFESTGNRFCGCREQELISLGGRDSF